MNEEKIIQAIADMCRDSSLHFQVIVQDNILHVYINRQTDIDYQLITRQIFAAIDSIKSLTFNSIYIYSRLLGEVEPDWQTYLVIKEAPDAALDSINYLATEITTEIENTNTLVEELKYQPKTESLVENIVDQVKTTGSLVSKLKKQLSTKTFDSLAEEFGEDSTEELVAEIHNPQDKVDLAQSQSSSAIVNLSQYCFVSDQKLLDTHTAPLASHIGQLIKSFDEFTFATKKLQLSVLEKYFETGKEPNSINLDHNTKFWWDKILQLDLDSRYKLALWLSRYCHDRAQTMTMVETISLIEETTQTQILLSIILIETAIINQNKALIYFCLSHRCSSLD